MSKSIVLAMGFVLVLASRALSQEGSESPAASSPPPSWGITTGTQTGSYGRYHRRPRPSAIDFAPPRPELGDYWSSGSVVPEAEHEERTAGASRGLGACCVVFSITSLMSCFAAWYFGPTARERAQKRGEIYSVS